MLKVLRLIVGRGAVVLAHRVKGYCSQVFRFAKPSGLVERDPCESLTGAMELLPEAKNHEVRVGAASSRCR